MTFPNTTTFISETQKLTDPYLGYIIGQLDPGASAIFPAGPFKISLYQSLAPNGTVLTDTFIFNLGGGAAIFEIIHKYTNDPPIIYRNLTGQASGSSAFQTSKGRRKLVSLLCELLTVSYLKWLAGVRFPVC